MSNGAIQVENTPGNMSGTHSVSATPGHHDRGLLAIGIFKLLKSAFFVCVGLGAMHMLHKDLGDALMRLAVDLRFDPEGHTVNFLMKKVTLIDVHRLREMGIGAFGYSALALTEGIGLMLEKVWAEYLTLCLTAALLPWELYELARRPDLPRVCLLLANLAVLGYLLWLLKRKREHEHASQPLGAAHPV